MYGFHDLFAFNYFCIYVCNIDETYTRTHEHVACSLEKVQSKPIQTVRFSVKTFLLSNLLACGLVSVWIRSFSSVSTYVCM